MQTKYIRIKRIINILTLFFQNTMAGLIRTNVIYTNPSRAKEIRVEMDGIDKLLRGPPEPTEEFLSLRKRLCKLIDEIENLVDEKATAYMHSRARSRAAMDK